MRNSKFLLMMVMMVQQAVSQTKTSFHRLTGILKVQEPTAVMMSLKICVTRITTILLNKHTRLIISSLKGKVLEMTWMKI